MSEDYWKTFEFVESLDEKGNLEFCFYISDEKKELGIYNNGPGCPFWKYDDIEKAKQFLSESLALLEKYGRKQPQ